MSLFSRLAVGAAVFCCGAALFAQAPNGLEQKQLFRQADVILKDAPDALKAIALDKKNGDLKRYNALRVAQDLAGKKSDLVYYSVPALSNVQYLPDQYPVDGTALCPLDIVMCRGEFEPGSLLLYSAKDMDKVQLTVTDLKSKDGKVIPKADVDLKVIKVWYQNGNAWYNYFGDFSHKLVLELLLNDENMILVDRVKQENYLRVNYDFGTKYFWCSAPEQIDPGFAQHREPVYDAKTLQPVKLIAGEFKQFFVTVKTTEKTAPGLYEGTISLGGRMNVPVRVRVLPIVLPDPKTYYNTDYDFYTMLYCVPGSGQYYGTNGNDQALSDKVALARFQNQSDHNVKYPLYLGLWRGWEGYENVKNGIALAKKAGMKMDPFFEAFGCHATNSVEAFLHQKRNAGIAKKAFKGLLGHTNLWPAGGEEPGYGRIVGARKNWKMVHDMDMHVMCNGGDRRNFSGYNDEFRVGGGFAQLKEADFMHRIKGRIGNYAGPHTGPENPDYMRRQHGLGLYKKDYDMMYNYGYHEGGWNDFHTNTYRNMNLVQYVRDGVIDTLAWEGIREGIDDIRYATCMLKLAEEAVATGKTDQVYAGKKAMQFLALLKEDEACLYAARMEMIRHILTLSKMLGK
ncbi:MAG: hypothetical protein J6C30_06390 [Lentisphaeria bacterium]|nr:hypothetical protein [Lentisphaeria bacterium]